MYTNAQVRAAQLAAQVLALVISNPAKAYPTALMDRLKERGIKTHTVEVRNSLEFLEKEGIVTALPLAKSSSNRPRRMYAPTLKAHFINALASQQLVPI